jgi:hypothetical protein
VLRTDAVLLATVVMSVSHTLDISPSNSGNVSIHNETHPDSTGKRTRPGGAVSWRPGMGLNEDSLDIPAMKRAKLASISLLYKSLEVRNIFPARTSQLQLRLCRCFLRADAIRLWCRASRSIPNWEFWLQAATWKRIADLRRKDEEERKKSREIADRYPLKFHERSPPRTDVPVVASPPEHDEPVALADKKWLTTPNLAPATRTVLTDEKAVAKAARMDISASISAESDALAPKFDEHMPEISI